MTYNRIAVKSVTSIVPGYGVEGSKYGELLSTSELLSNMTHGNTFELGNNFIDVRLGIQTISSTTTTANVTRLLWNNGIHAHEAARYAGYVNACLYSLLRQAISKVIAEVSTFNRSVNICSHIHVVSYVQPTVEYELMRIRRELGIDHTDLHTLIIQQGCAGLFSALKTARNLLSTSDATTNDVVLLTAESNMMPYVHQRATAYANYTDIDSWLFCQPAPKVGQ